MRRLAWEFWEKGSVLVTGVLIKGGDLVIKV
jgi:hypothetical protein